MIEESEDLYPGIDIWFKKKVTPELQKGSRHAIIVYSDGEPVGSAVIRRGSEAKLCSMRVLDDFQSDGIGSLLMALITLELHNNINRKTSSCSNIHFTIPEDIWDNYQLFFKDYGFNMHGLSGHQYRQHTKELACVSSYRNTWDKVMETLPDLLIDLQLSDENPTPEILLSVHPKYAENILNGKKTIEIRKNFPTRWAGSSVAFYATDPIQMLLGQAIISYVETDSPENIWEKYYNNICCSYDEFIRYCGNKTKVSALKFEQITPYNRGIRRTELELHMKANLIPPQSYNIIRNNKGWDAAVSLGKILCNRF
jgi:predicted transcriptional regulator